MRAYSKTRGEHIRFSNLKEEETINHVFNSSVDKFEYSFQMFH